uniref:LOB domain-containing protein n=1 Tax=Kalanchoe fedtschenkoi TaxID=63787 RepID=A0A7N0U026_KALFE
MSRERDKSSQFSDELEKRIKRSASVGATETITSEYNSASDQMIVGRRQMLGSPGRRTRLNTITPCAACKLLRRRCAQECPFFPYFSPHEPQKFASVHKVFGASNVSKMLMEVPEAHRADTANSLVYEANVRLRDPVYGCMGAISALQQQVQSMQAEINAIRAEILNYKLREEANGIVTTNSYSNYMTSNFIPPSPPWANITVASLTPRPPSSSVVAATSASHLLTTTTSSSVSVYTNQSSIRNVKMGYSNSIVNENVRYLD